MKATLLQQAGNIEERTTVDVGGKTRMSTPAT
jgi:hypothetical protein